jgi:hypothetical protein
VHAAKSILCIRAHGDAGRVNDHPALHLGDHLPCTIYTPGAKLVIPTCISHTLAARLENCTHCKLRQSLTTNDWSYSNTIALEERAHNATVPKPAFSPTNFTPCIENSQAPQGIGTAWIVCHRLDVGIPEPTWPRGCTRMEIYCTAVHYFRLNDQ